MWLRCSCYSLGPKLSFYVPLALVVACAGAANNNKRHRAPGGVRSRATSCGTSSTNNIAATTNSHLDARATQGSSFSRRTAPQRLRTPGSPCIPKVTSHFPGSYRNAPFYFYRPRASGWSTVVAQLRCCGSPPAGGTDGGSPFECSSARPSSAHGFQRACRQAR